MRDPRPALAPLPPRRNRSAAAGGIALVGEAAGTRPHQRFENRRTIMAPTGITGCHCPDAGNPRSVAGLWPVRASVEASGAEKPESPVESETTALASEPR